MNDRVSKSSKISFNCGAPGNLEFRSKSQLTLRQRWIINSGAECCSAKSKHNNISQINSHRTALKLRFASMTLAHQQIFWEVHRGLWWDSIRIKIPLASPFLFVPVVFAWHSYRIIEKVATAANAGGWGAGDPCAMFQRWEMSCVVIRAWFESKSTKSVRHWRPCDFIIIFWSSSPGSKAWSAQ